jgi:hypothetical protein
MTRFTNSIWFGGVALVVKEGGERVLGGGPVESDESPDEETEPAGLFDGPRDVAGGSGPGFDQHLLEFCEIGGRDGAVAVELLDREAVTVLGEEPESLAPERLELVRCHQAGKRVLAFAEGVLEVR